MTIYADLPAVEAPAPEPRRRWSRRRIAVTAAVTVLLLAIVGTGLGWAVYANTYQPIGPAGFGESGPTMRQNMKVVSDHLGDHTFIGVGPATASITANYTIANNGSHDIVILGPDNGLSSAPLKLQWSAPTVEAPDSAFTSPTYPTDARPFPATLKAHHSIELYVTLAKTGCPPHAYYEIFGVPIRWKALGVHHVTVMPLAANSDFYPIALCVPAEALRLATDAIS